MPSSRFSNSVKPTDFVKRNFSVAEDANAVDKTIAAMMTTANPTLLNGFNFVLVVHSAIKPIMLFLKSPTLTDSINSNS